MHKNTSENPRRDADADTQNDEIADVSKMVIPTLRFSTEDLMLLIQNHKTTTSAKWSAPKKNEKLSANRRRKLA